MYPVPTVTDLSNYSGRAQSSYSTFAQNALIQATVMFTALTEQYSASSLLPDDQQLANLGICAMADYIYLRQPYQQVIANPLMNETIGSYSYSKPMQEMARNAQAMEVMSEATGVTMFDLAVRMLALRTRAGGVFNGGITMFERVSRFGIDDAEDFNALGLQAARFDGAGLFVECGVNDLNQTQYIVRGPNEFNTIDWQMFDYNAEVFPGDPGVG